MKRFLTYNIVSLVLAFVFIWSVPTATANAAHPPAYSCTVDQLGATAPSLSASATNSPTNSALIEQVPVIPSIASRQLFTGEFWKRTELYFGSQRADLPPVTEDEFKQFVDAAVTPRFPDGLTLLAGYGQFRNSEGDIVKEQSMVLILLYPLRMNDANKKIHEIREAYKYCFQQESVLRVDGFAWVSF